MHVPDWVSLLLSLLLVILRLAWQREQSRLPRWLQDWAPLLDDPDFQARLRDCARVLNLTLPAAPPGDPRPPEAIKREALADAARTEAEKVGVELPDHLAHLAAELAVTQLKARKARKESR